MDTTSIVPKTLPSLLRVSIFAMMLPFSPGLRWLKPAIVAMHPQEAVNRFIDRSSVPMFMKSKEYSS